MALVAALNGCANEGSEPLDRKAQLRQAILRNLHFNLHCMCRTADERTVEAVRNIAREPDIGVLGELLHDPDPAVVIGASGALIWFAESELEELRPKLDSAQWTMDRVLDGVQLPAIDTLRREAAAGTVASRAAAIDALVQIEVAERARRKELKGRG